MNKDLTVGKTSDVLWKFCIPLFASIIFQQLYNIADSFVAGKFIGEEALAAVGNSYEITLIFIAFAFGCNIGCSVIVAQLFGAKQYTDMKTAVYTTFISGGILCIVLMTGGLVFCKELLHLIQTPQNVFEDSHLYLLIYLLGLPFVFFYNIATGVFSALGDSKTPFIFLACSSVANIGADILFVTAFDMGVAGVAWATFICQGVSCVLAVIVVVRRLGKVQTTHKACWFSLYLFKRIASIAIPSILQQSFISVGNIVIQGIINGFGSAAMAGYSASIKLNNLVITSLTTVGNGISNFSAQNLGAGKPERIREGFKAGIRMVWTICIPLSILYIFGGRTLVTLFMNNPSEQVLSVGVEILRVLAPFYCVVAAKLVSDGILRGTGKMKQFMFGTFTDLLLRVLFAYVLSALLGTLGIWLAWPIGWTIATVISLLFYKKSSF